MVIKGTFVSDTSYTVRPQLPASLTDDTRLLFAPKNIVMTEVKVQDADGTGYDFKDDDIVKLLNNNVQNSCPPT